MEYVNISLPCFSGMDNRTIQLYLSFLKLSVVRASPLFLAIPFLAIPLNVLSIVVVLKSVRKPCGSQDGAIGEGPIHLVLLAISDIFVAISPWIIWLSLNFEEKMDFCNIVTLRHVLNTWMYIVVDTNRWFTFYMAVQRCRVIFSFNYSINQLRNSTRTNLKRSIGYGLICGFAQGVISAAAPVLIISSYPQQIAPLEIAVSVHPLILTPAMICVTVSMIVKLKINGAAAPRSTAFQPVYREFQTSTVAVCLFYVLCQIAYIAFTILRGMDSDRQYDAAFFSSLFTHANSTFNFFIYLVASKRFRAQLKYFILKCVSYQSADDCDLPAGHPPQKLVSFSLSLSSRHSHNIPD